MDILIVMILIYLTFHFLHYGFSKKTKSQREMDSIDTLIDDALRGEWTPINRKKNNS